MLGRRPELPRRLRPEAFLDITQGTNALFGGSCCPARTGYDLATGWGSPMANAVAGLLGSRG